jgi:hypothetical protein
MVYGETDPEVRRAGNFRMVFNNNGSVVYDETSTTDTTGDTSAIVLSAVSGGATVDFKVTLTSFGDNAVIVYLAKFIYNQ